jgi:hypothetical protein
MRFGSINAAAKNVLGEPTLAFYRTRLVRRHTATRNVYTYRPVVFLSINFGHDLRRLKTAHWPPVT